MDERGLIAAAQEGDQRAFAELVRRHRNHAWAVCLQITGDRHEAEDALQDALTAAWQNLHRFRGAAKFSTWLHRIAANAALMIVRRRREVLNPTDEEVDQVDPAPSPADRVVDRTVVRQALARLPEDFREALVLREFGDLTYAEIAEHQGVALGTVKTRINRARRRLVEDLTDTVVAP